MATAAAVGAGFYYNHKLEEQKNVFALTMEGAHLELNSRLMAIRWEAEKEFIETTVRNDELDSLIKTSKLAEHGRFSTIPDSSDVDTTDKVCRYLHDQEAAAQEYLKAASEEEIRTLIKNPENFRTAANDDTAAEQTLCRGMAP
jgi:hypothetical protein